MRTGKEIMKLDKQSTLDKCDHCREINIPHDIHWRNCSACKKITFHSFLNWKTDQDPDQTSCDNCGNLE